jgi:hypothetical protein
MEHGDEIEFRKSMFSQGASNCVEVGLGENGVRLVRDSKHRGGLVLRFSESEWDAFVKGVRAGEFG